MENEKEFDVNGFTLMYHWMTSELGLKNTQKELYAIVYNFSKNGKDKWCFLSTGTIKKMTGISQININNNFAKLVDKGLLVRREHTRHGCNVTYAYRAVRCDNERALNEVTENEKPFNVFNRV